MGNRRYGSLTADLLAKPMSTPRVFISYRHDDVPTAAGRLCDALSHRLGPGSVFFDERALEPGHDFLATIRHELERCQALLVVIGSRWLQDDPATGQPRLHGVEDVVRLEIETAAQLGVRIVPVLVEGAAAPRPNELPPSMHKFAGLHASRFSNRHWSHDLDALVSSLVEHRPRAGRATDEYAFISTNRPAWAVSIDHELDRLPLDDSLLPAAIAYGAGAAREQREASDYLIRARLGASLAVGTRALLTATEAEALAGHGPAHFPRELRVDLPPEWRLSDGCAFILTDIPYFQRAWRPGATSMPVVLGRPGFSGFVESDGRPLPPLSTSLADVDPCLGVVGLLTLVGRRAEAIRRSPYVLLARRGIRHASDELFGADGRPLLSDAADDGLGRRFAFLSPSFAALLPALFTCDHLGDAMRCIAGHDDAYHNSFMFNGRQVGGWVAPRHVRYATHRTGVWSITVSEDRE
jgi:hypothetical protein